MVKFIGNILEFRVAPVFQFRGWQGEFALYLPAVEAVLEFNVVALAYGTPRNHYFRNTVLS